MVVVAGRKPHVLNMLGVSTGTLPVSVCLLPVPVSTLSCTPFHRSPTINSQRFALFDSTFSVRFKLISHSLSAPFPLPLRSAEDAPTCLVCVCRRLPPSVAVCRGGTRGLCELVADSVMLYTRARGVKRAISNGCAHIVRGEL